VSILTVDEIHAVCPNAKSQRDLFDFAAGITAALERACNRTFAKRISNATAINGTVTATIPRHGFKVGQRIAVAAINAAPHFEGLMEVASVSGWDQFTFGIDSQLASEAAIELSVRPVREVVMQTRGGQAVFLDPRPVAEVVSVEIGEGGGTFAAPLGASKYALGDLIDGVSFTGELVLYEQRFPERRGTFKDGRWATAGARISYVSGEPNAPSDIIYGAKRAMKSVWDRKDRKNADFQSESYDYYSYSRMGADQLAALFGELESIIQSHRVAVI
jgi:hypothetical protein